MRFDEVSTGVGELSQVQQRDIVRRSFCENLLQPALSVRGSTRIEIDIGLNCQAGVRIGIFLEQLVELTRKLAVFLPGQELLPQLVVVLLRLFGDRICDGWILEFRARRKRNGRLEQQRDQENLHVNDSERTLTSFTIRSTSSGKPCPVTAETTNSLDFRNGKGSSGPRQSTLL